MSLAYVQAIVAVVLALLGSWAALMAAVSLLLPVQSEGAEEVLRRSPRRSFLAGLGMVVVLIVALKLAAVPAPILKLFGVLVLLSTGVVISVGAAGITRLMARRIGELTGARPGVGTLLGAGVIFSLALLFPLIGWWVFSPLAGIFSLGAGAQSMVNWAGAAREARATRAALDRGEAF